MEWILQIAGGLFQNAKWISTTGDGVVVQCPLLLLLLLSFRSTLLHCGMNERVMSRGGGFTGN